MDRIGELDDLPTVSDALRLPYDQYKKHADGIVNFRDYCLLGLTEAIPKVHEWCIHLNCTEPDGPCTPIPSGSYFPVAHGVTSTTTTVITTLTAHIGNNSESLWEFVNVLRQNGTRCYDDYFCDHEGMSLINHYVLGYGCFLLCVFGIVSNLVLLPAYNLGLNRSGATVYLSAMAIFDLIYLFLTLLIVVSRYAHEEFREQIRSYAQFSARLVPIGVPIMQFCELLVVWIVVALLANRLLYMNFGFQSKTLCSQLQSLKWIAAFLLFGLAYCSCKFLEYTLVEYKSIGVVQVVRTPLGENTMFQNLMYHWLKVPIQMFLPYLTVVALICVVVRKMLGFHKSKWKAVASLCNDTACACVCRTGVCGTACKEGAVQRPTEMRPITTSDSACTVTRQPTAGESSSGKQQLPGKSPSNNTDPIEQELAYLFFQLPQIDETREHANVVAAVCFGLLLLLLKVPKFIIHVLSTENYINHDPAVLALIDQVLDLIFATCKPTVCILVGAHFRQVLLMPQQCCTPATRIINSATNNEECVELGNVQLA